MKRYNKPRTDITMVIIEGSLMAGTTNGPAVNNSGSDDKVSDPTEILGKKNSLWDPDRGWDSDEEE